ncbi:MAG: GNAT family N-acetyltransferase [Proteobacteria bacterium]|nr:GNAT family N-acetyltransferase [Pseudomonadota bacterium]
MDYCIRKARDRDGESVIGIFNLYVRDGLAAFPEREVGHDFFVKLKIMSRGYPFHVVERSGRIVGFGLMSPFRYQSAFNRSAFVTYFIEPAHTCRGLGGRLLGLFETEAAAMGVDNLMASVSSSNQGSLAFHQKNGFVECGRMVRVGRKFGLDFDLVYLQKCLNP